MPGSSDEAEETASSVLPDFVSIPEQTCKEFLSVFTGLPRGRGGRQVQGDRVLQGPSSEMQTARRAQELDEPEQHSLVKERLRYVRTAQKSLSIAVQDHLSTDSWKHRITSVQVQWPRHLHIHFWMKVTIRSCTEHILKSRLQLAIGEGVTVGRCHSPAYSGRVQVDNFFTASDNDPDSDKEAPDPSVMLYPGEADTANAVNKPIIRSSCLETHAASTPETATDEHLDDEIRPFSLDQSFDYDRVALTPKLSVAEMKFLEARGQLEVGEEESAEQT